MDENSACLCKNFWRVHINKNNEQIFISERTNYLIRPENLLKDLLEVWIKIRTLILIEWEIVKVNIFLWTEYEFVWFKIQLLCKSTE